MDIEILYEKNFFFIITKYSPISNSNVNTVITDMKNIESSTDSDSSNKGYTINNISFVIIIIEIILLIIVVLVIVKIGILILMIVKTIVSLTNNVVN